MIRQLSDSRLANLGASAIYNSFLEYRCQFEAVTLRAKNCFQNRQWQQGQLDTVERLDLYKKVIDGVVGHIRELLADRGHEKLVWVSLKAVYSGLIAQRDDWEVAETFFNSITRRIFATVGLDPQIEFVDTDFDTPPTRSTQAVFNTFTGNGSFTGLIERIMRSYSLGVEFEDLSGDIRAVVAEISNYLASGAKTNSARLIEKAEMLKPVFTGERGLI